MYHIPACFIEFLSSHLCLYVPVTVRLLTVQYFKSYVMNNIYSTYSIPCECITTMTCDSAPIINHVDSLAHEVTPRLTLHQHNTPIAIAVSSVLGGHSSTIYQCR